jgi:3-methyl-2-oxobutanoate hydroxymethyltransferase
LSVAHNSSRITIPQLVSRKGGEPIAVLTAYTAPIARLVDPHVDAILVGDSLGMVIMGHETTLEVTLDMMVHHTRAVRNGTRHALVIADMPFLTFQTGVDDAVRNAGRLIQEGGAAAVKLEGGRASSDVIARLVEIGIPVMGHIGLTPQSVHQLGGFKKIAGPAAEKLLEEARIVQDSGAFAIVLESIPSDIAREITQALTIPTIGIGAGPHCDGQVLVSYDALGLFDEFTPSFVKRYAELGKEIVRSAREYIDDVRSGRFPK